MKKVLPLAAFGIASIGALRSARAGDVNADPSSFVAALGALKPGDTLHLAAGTYPHLTITDKNGTASSPIVIEGAPGGATVIVGDSSHNTVEIVRSSYLVVRGLTVDSKGMDGVFGVSAKDGTSNVVHDVTIEACHFIGQSGSQQTVAISTKTPTWNWIIRGNVIDGAGTGLYLGNSDGSFPFVAGLIEGNVIRNTIGYNGQIKFQKAWPTGTGLPTGPNRTIVRNNVFLKNDQPSPDGDRPNLLIGGGPTSGPGSSDLYEVYGNFFFHNPREALLQVAGRVTIHDNVFVDSSSAAIVAQNHDVPLAMVRIYDNTLYTKGIGIHVGAATETSFVVGNLVFAATPIDGTITTKRDNLTDAFANAASYVNKPSYTLGTMDFYPLAGKAQGAAMDLAATAGDTDRDKDFNGTSRGTFVFRGAYAGDGTNPGWAPVDGPKGSGPASPPDAGPTSDAGGSDAAVPSDAAISDSGGEAPTGGEADGSGCGCRTTRSDPSPPLGLALVAMAVAARARRSSPKKSSEPKVAPPPPPWMSQVYRPYEHVMKEAWSFVQGADDAALLTAFGRSAESYPQRSVEAKTAAKLRRELGNARYDLYLPHVILPFALSLHLDRERGSALLREALAVTHDGQSEHVRRDLVLLAARTVLDAEEIRREVLHGCPVKENPRDSSVVYHFGRVLAGTTAIGDEEILTRAKELVEACLGRTPQQASDSTCSLWVALSGLAIRDATRHRPDIERLAARLTEALGPTSKSFHQQCVEATFRSARQGF